jgi:SAF domain-containing protein
MTTRAKSTSGPAGSVDRSRDAALRPLPRTVRRGRVLGGLLVVVVAGTLTGWLFATSGQRVPVVMVARDVPVGTVLSAADLTTTRVAADPSVPTIPADQLGSVAGRVAAVDLRRGTLLAPSQITAALTPGQGQQIVAVAMKASQLPAGELRPGDHVLVVPTPQAPGAAGGGPGGDAAAPLVKETAAVVDRVGSADAEGLVVVNLLVSADVGTQIARQASTGRLALVVTARTP